MQLGTLNLDLRHVDRTLRTLNATAQPARNLDDIRDKLRDNYKNDSFKDPKIGRLLQNLILISGERKELQVEFLRLKIQHSFNTRNSDNLYENYKLLRQLDPTMPNRAQDLYLLVEEIANTQPAEKLAKDKGYKKLCRNIAAMIPPEGLTDLNKLGIVFSQLKLCKQGSSTFTRHLRTASFLAQQFATKETFSEPRVGRILQNLILISEEHKNLQVQFLRLKLQHNFSTGSADHIVDNYIKLKKLKPDLPGRAQNLYDLMVSMTKDTEPLRLVGDKHYRKLARNITHLLIHDGVTDFDRGEIIYCESRTFVVGSNGYEGLASYAAMLGHSVATEELFNYYTIMANAAEEDNPVAYNAMTTKRFNLISSAYRRAPDKYRHFYVQCLLDVGEPKTMNLAEEIVKENKDILARITYLRVLSELDLILEPSDLALAEEVMFTVTEGKESQQLKELSVVLYGLIAVKTLRNKQEFLRTNVEAEHNIIDNLEFAAEAYPVALMLLGEAKHTLDPNGDWEEPLVNRMLEHKDLKLAEFDAFIAAYELKSLLGCTLEGQFDFSDRMKELQKQVMLAYDISPLRVMNLLVESQNNIVAILNNGQERIRLDYLYELRESFIQRDDLDSNLVEMEPNAGKCYKTETILRSVIEQTVKDKGYRSFDDIYNLETIPGRLA